MPIAAKVSPPTAGSWPRTPGIRNRRIGVVRAGETTFAGQRCRHERCHAGFTRVMIDLLRTHLESSEGEDQLRRYRAQGGGQRRRLRGNTEMWGDSMLGPF